MWVGGTQVVPCGDDLLIDNSEKAETSKIDGSACWKNF